MKTQTFVGGIFVLLAGSLIAKLLGAFYRVPLTWVLGAEGLGIYQLVFPVFSLLLVLSSTGTPTAISTMVATRIKDGKYKEAEKVFQISRNSLLFVGIITGAILCILSELLASLQGNELATYPYIAIAFAVPMVSLLSAFRGYYQGCMNMVPTAMSQVVEQVGKLAFGLLFSYLLLPAGIEFASLGAVLGLVLGELLAVVVMYLYKFLGKKKKVQIDKIVDDNVAPTKVLAKELGKTAMPIVLASFMLPALQVIDSLLVVNLLNMGGYSTAEATIMWGINSGVVNSIINMPVVLSLAVATAIVPELSLKDREITDSVKSKIVTAQNFTIKIALPCSMGILLLAPFIISFLYSDTLVGGSINQVDIATNLLAISSIFIFIIALMQVQSASMQGIGKAKIPLYHILIAGVVKIGLLITLVQIPSINIYGVYIANLVFYLLVFLLNSAYLRGRLSIKTHYIQLLPSVIATIVMSFILLLARFAFVKMNVYMALPLELLIGIIVYIYTLLILGGLGDIKKILKNLWSKVYKRKVL